MARTSEEARGLLRELGDHLRELVIGARGMDMASIEGETVADTIYAIDKVVDDTLIRWFEQHWPDVEVVTEGLNDPVVVGAHPEWTVIVDTIDGTRGLMYDKRPAWSLAAAAPHGGTLRDIVAAAMTELPTTKQGAADQLSGVRGGGVTAARLDLGNGSRRPLRVGPSTATDLEHGFGGLAKFFVPGKGESQRGDGGTAAPGCESIHSVGAPTISSAFRRHASMAATVPASRTTPVRRRASYDRG